jgi:hexulose-6-phosphate isomerase
MGCIGVMQGRLLPPVDGRIQRFPAGAWAEEFALAAAVPLDSIEWIYEAHGADDNPLGTSAGLDRLRALTKTHGVAVRSVCADYFMDRPLLRVSDAERREREQVLSWLLQQCQQVGIERLVLPFVDASRMATTEDRRLVAESMQAITPLLERTGVEIHLETDLPPGDFARLLTWIEHPKVCVNYDSGNSASLGYSPGEEFAAYGRRVGSIHIKDRVRGGGTVPLGCGDADFDGLFAEVRRIGYSGDFVLQAARGVPGQEVAWARSNCAFLQRYLNAERTRSVSDALSGS